jgi:ribosomal protein S18 acetylase RimI-like enzyme
MTMGDRNLPRLRVAAQQDIPALVRLINLAYRVEAFFIRGERTSAEEVGSMIGAEEGTFLVLEVPGRSGPVGSVFVTLDGETGHLGFLAVDPAHQGQGLGRRLLVGVETFCLNAGCTAVELDVFNLREELPRYYRSAGFVEIGTAQFSHPELLLRPAHLIRMRKAIAR